MGGMLWRALGCPTSGECLAYWPRTSPILTLADGNVTLAPWQLPSYLWGPVCPSLRLLRGLADSDGPDSHCDRRVLGPRYRTHGRAASLWFLPLSTEKGLPSFLPSILPSILIYLFIYLFILAALGLSCGMQDLSVVACRLWVAACVLGLVPWPGIEPWPPAWGAQSLTHWTTREVPGLLS